MDGSPDIRDLPDAQLPEECFEVHLMHNALDIGHTDLERGMNMLPAVVSVNELRILRGNEPLAVELRHFHVCQRFYPVIAPHGILRAVVLHGDDVRAAHDGNGIVHDDDTRRIPDAPVLTARPAGEHEAVVGIELGELAEPDDHAQLDALPHRRINVLTDEG